MEHRPAIPKGSSVIFIVVKFKVKPDWSDRWLGLVQDFTQATRQEPGNLWFDWSRSVEDPNEFVLVEAFKDDAAGDHVPAYRLSAGSRVQRLGAAGPWWSTHLKPLRTRLLEETGAGSSPLVVDSRSGAYRSMLPLRSGHGARVLQVAPVQERGGVRKVISHDAKRYRGIVTRELIAAPELPGDADALVDLLRERLAAVPGVAGAPLGVELDGDQLVVVDPVG